MDTMRTLTSIAAGLAFVAVAPLAGHAQEDPDDDPVFAVETGAGQGIGLKVNAGYNTFGGDLGDLSVDGEADQDFLDEGVGFEAVLSHGWSSGFELGVGAGFGSYDVPGATADRSGDIITAFVEPLYRFNVGSPDAPHLHPFIGARAGYANLSLDEDEPFDDIGFTDDSRGGFMAGGLGGLELWFTNQVGVVGTVAYDYLSFDLTDDEQVNFDDEDTLAGGRLGFNAGLKVRFQ